MMADIEPILTAGSTIGAITILGGMSLRWMQSLINEARKIRIDLDEENQRLRERIIGHHDEIMQLQEDVRESRREEELCRERERLTATAILRLQNRMGDIEDKEDYGKSSA